MAFVKKNFFFDPKSQFFFHKIFAKKKFKPISISPDIYNKTQDIMDMQKYIYNQTKVMLPITGSGSGLSKDQPVIMTSKAKHIFIGVQNEYISTILDDVNWDKVEQSLIIEDGKKYDKITIHQYMSDGDVFERVFWFEITESF